MNLAYRLTETVEIDGTTHPIDLSFDNVLRLIDMLNDKDLNDETQIEIGLYMLLGVNLDMKIETKEEVFYKIVQEILADDVDDNGPVDIEGNLMPKKKEETIYSIEQDSPYIYASFFQDYGIDLFEMQGKLHWEKFKALLEGLKVDTKFKEIINIRTMELPTGKGSDKQRKQVKELKEYYKIKDN